MEEKSKKEEHILFGNLTYSFIGKYSGLFLNIFSAMILARFLNPTSWGYLLIALAYVYFITFILHFFPPGLHEVLDYFIPKYVKLNKKYGVKLIYKYSIIIKLGFSLAVFFISLLAFYSLSLTSGINLGGNIYLIFILSPMIFMEDLKFVFQSIYRGLNKYKTMVIINMLPFLLNIGGLLVGVFIYSSFSISRLGIAALIRLFSVLIPFVIFFLLILKDYYKISYETKGDLDFKTLVYEMFKYGSFISITKYRGKTEMETKSIIISYFEPSKVVTGYRLTYQFKVTLENLSQAFLFPMTNSFSRLYATKTEENKKLIKKTYNILYKYNLIIILIISSCFYFLSDFILFTLYSKPYLEFSIYLKILVMTSVFTASNNIFYAYIKGTNKVKTLSLIFPLFVFINLFSIIIGLLTYGVIGLLMGEFISQFIVLIIQIIISNKVFKLELDLKILSLLYCIFFGLIMLTNFLNFLFMEDVFLWLINSLNLTFFRYCNVIALLVFLVLFAIFLLNTRIIKIEEIEIFENLLLNIRDSKYLKKLIDVGKKVVKKLSFVK